MNVAPNAQALSFPDATLLLIGEKALKVTGTHYTQLAYLPTSHSPAAVCGSATFDRVYCATKSKLFVMKWQPGDKGWETVVSGEFGRLGIFHLQI